MMKDPVFSHARFALFRIVSERVVLTLKCSSWVADLSVGRRKHNGALYSRRTLAR